MSFPNKYAGKQKINIEHDQKNSRIIKWTQNIFIPWFMYHLKKQTINTNYRDSFF